MTYSWQPPRVVITGVGLISGLGQSYGEVLDGFRQGRSGVSYMPEWEAPALGLRTRIGAYVRTFSETRIDRRMRRSMSRIAMMATEASRQALGDSGLSPEQIKSERTGISYGSSFGGTGTIEEYFRGFHQSGILTHGLTSTTFLKIMPHTCAANIAINFGIPGRIVASCVACASSTQAIGFGYEAIRLGVVDRMVCGGAEELTPTSAAIFDVLNATSIGHHDDPAGASRPFDKDRDGIVVGEGAGTFVLETEASARQRGAKIYAEIVGFYTNNDASHMTNPSIEGLTSCMQGALAQAGLKADQVDYINAHAAGTVAGDRAEALAIARLFTGRPPVSSMKGHLGHLMGAAGALELAACFGMLADQAVYPTLNFQAAAAGEGGLNYACGGVAPGRVQRIIKNSFAFGGVNASIVLQKGEV